MTTPTPQPDSRDGERKCPRVLHQQNRHAEAVYVGRPTKWGNPFVIGKDGTRDQVIALYRAHILARPDLLRALPELRGKDLVCWCAPKACHGDVLLELANGGTGKAKGEEDE